MSGKAWAWVWGVVGSLVSGVLLSLIPAGLAFYVSIWGAITNGFSAFGDWFISPVTVSVYTIFIALILWLGSIALTAITIKKLLAPQPNRWPSLSERESEVLHLVFSANNANVDPYFGQLSDNVSMSRVELTYALEVLNRHHLVQSSHDFYKGTTFSLSPYGRKYAIEHFIG